MLATCVIAASAFAPQPVLLPSSPAAVRATEPLMLGGHRAALLTGAALTASTVLPAFAGIEEIAAANAAAAEAARKAAAEAPVVDEEAEKSKAINSIGLLLVGGTALSVPFYFKNLQRLGTKVASGGKDDGYNRYKGK